MQALTERAVKLPYELTPWQRRVRDDPHRFKVACAGRRSGKTQLALDMLIENVSTVERALGWYVAPTYGMAKDIAWGLLKHNTADFYRAGLIKRYYDGDLTIEFLGGRLLQLKSGDKPDSLRGRGLSFLAVDEPATMEKGLWKEVLRPAIADREAPAFFGGTPKGFNHFYDLYKMEADPVHAREWKSFRVTTAEAGLISVEEIARARQDMDERAFQQEFEASFENFGGRVFPMFSRETHAGEVAFKPELEYYLGMDFGWSSPTYAAFIQVDPAENVSVFDELARRETPMQKFAELIRAKKLRDPDIIFCDPAGESKSEATGTSSVYELRQAGFTVKHKHNYPGIIQDRVTLIRKWLLNGKFKADLKKCPLLIEALGMYRYPEEKNGIYSELPLKDGVSDHPVDGTGYFFINRFPVMYSTVGVL